MVPVNALQKAYRLAVVYRLKAIKTNGDIFHTHNCIRIFIKATGSFTTYITYDYAIINPQMVNCNPSECGSYPFKLETRIAIDLFSALTVYNRFILFNHVYGFVILAFTADIIFSSYPSSHRSKVQ